MLKNTAVYNIEQYLYSENNKKKVSRSIIRRDNDPSHIVEGKILQKMKTSSSNLNPAENFQICKNIRARKPTDFFFFTEAAGEIAKIMPGVI